VDTQGALSHKLLADLATVVRNVMKQCRLLSFDSERSLVAGSCESGKSF
jgi:hypothetical protein